MEPRGGMSRRPPGGGKSVAGKLGLFGGLLAVVVGGMIGLYWVSQQVHQQAPTKSETGEKASQGEAAKPVGQTPGDAATVAPDGAAAAPRDVGASGEPEPAEGTIPGATELKPLAEMVAENPSLNQDFPPPAPWPSDAELPILRRYDIDWEAGASRLMDVRDHAEIRDEDYELDEAALYYLMRTVTKLPREAFVPGAKDDEADYDALRSTPKQFRGVPVTVSGVVDSVAKWEVPRPKLTGFDHFWKVELYKPVEGNLVNNCTLFVFEDPGPSAVKSKVRTKGYFYRIRDYETNHYDEEAGANVAYRYSCPIVVTRSLEVIPQPAIAGMSSQGQVLMVVIIAGIGTLMAMVYFFVRRMAGRRELYKTAGRQQELSDEERAERVRFLEDVERSGGKD